MQELFTLGELYVSDFITEGEESMGGTQPLTLVFDDRYGTVRLKDVVDPDVMYGKYWYRSGINQTMTNELFSIADEAIELVPMKLQDIFLDIACNDGTLLNRVMNCGKEFTTVGIDPADDSFANDAKQYCDYHAQDYFSADVYRGLVGDKKAKVVTCIAMFYDLNDPVSFLRDVEEIMDDEGVLIIQMSYTPLMLRQLAFDNICHEHVYYHSLTSMSIILGEAGFAIADVKLNDINGGSFRVYARKHKADPTKFRTAPYRDVAHFRFDALLSEEERMDVVTPEPYLQFFQKLQNLKEEVVSFIRRERGNGKMIMGYGASTKGNTLLQYFGLDHTLIDAIAERNPDKYGLKTVGTEIPIISEAQMRAIHPDYLLVLPWHFINEFKQRERTYLEGGGQFIVPCPQFEIIGL